MKILNYFLITCVVVIIALGGRLIILKMEKNKLEDEKNKLLKKQDKE